MIRFCSLFLVLAAPVFADVTGPVRVIDGDTIVVSGERIRLHGIDAPEGNQTCLDRAGRRWSCGEFVTAEVRARYEGRIAACEQLDRDRYGRMVARCIVDGRDMGEEIVADGLAEAYRRYSMDYDLTEKGAQVREVGIWAGEMQSPAAFRAQQNAPRTAAPPNSSCIIKGNISSSGRIYHMPHNRDYDRTVINTQQGERWFCTEAEARAAGWRAARN